MPAEIYDVIICGGGPIGLLTAYGLQRMNIKTIVIEKLIKTKMPMYGRAISLYPRSSELLDQYDLLDTMVQEAFISRGSATFKDGKRVTSRGWQQIFTEMGASHVDYMLNLRMKYSENIFREAYQDLGGVVLEGWELQELSETGGVEIIIANVESGEKQVLKGNWLIGADGAHSTVRTLAKFPFESGGIGYRWIRIDGRIESDMPDSDLGMASIESPTHGNVFYMRLDHGDTRVGFNMTPEMSQKYGDDMTVEEIITEAKESMIPFQLDFKNVTWTTSYKTRQGLTDYYMRDNIILTGDACHVHSSATGQGMNTGIHDAINLAWKLAGVIKGWYKQETLQTYESERRPIAEKVIELDKNFSTLISGGIPEKYKSAGMDPNEMFSRLFDDSIRFSMGFAVAYNENLINRAAESGMVSPGHRAPDGLLRKPGAKLPIRLQELMKNFGKFWVIVFVGEPILTQNRLKQLRCEVDKFKFQHVNYMTIIAGNKPQGEEAIGVKRFGNVYFDWDNSVHYKFGYTLSNGGLSVLRPEGVLGFATTLENGEAVGNYLSGFLTTA